jgi:hypothetical protein
MPLTRKRMRAAAATPGWSQSSSAGRLTISWNLRPSRENREVISPVPGEMSTPS